MTSYLDTKNGTPRNATHWMLDPLDGDVLALLRRMDDGGRLRNTDRLNLAYLVARECVGADLEATPMRFWITEKGHDALAFYSKHPGEDS